MVSFLLTCPNCGTRDVSEFRYGGQIIETPPPLAPPSEGWERRGSNLPGPQRERWFHRFGCRRWLVAERDVRTNEVLQTAWLDDAPAVSGEGTAH